MTYKKRALYIIILHSSVVEASFLDSGVVSSSLTWGKNCFFHVFDLFSKFGVQIPARIGNFQHLSAPIRPMPVSFPWNLKYTHKRMSWGKLRKLFKSANLYTLYSTSLNFCIFLKILSWNFEIVFLYDILHKYRLWNSYRKCPKFFS